MNRCRHPDHPHCTVWVLPGEGVCAHGHAQPAAEPATPVVHATGGLPSSFDVISALRAGRSPAAATPLVPQAVTAGPALQRPQLHISGFDPRAAGGRQAIKLELRGMPMDCAPEVSMLVRSGLRLRDGDLTVFQRTSRGDWRPVFLEFSSRGLEHGQYRIEIELHSRHPQRPDASRTWTCSPVILVPRLDATLGEIHQTFLATHKNVRVMADDAGIARVQAPGGGSVDIDVTARNASIAQVDLREPAGGKIDLGFSTIAWDEDLIEIDVPVEVLTHPCPASSACLVHAEPDSAAQRHLRLFALGECLLGRFEEFDPDADLLLAHHGEHGEERGGLTRRLSGRHAIIRQGRHGFEIEDVSRYGVLLDGVWPGKHTPVLLRLGMQIAFTASIRGVVELEVSALLPHGVILHRIDAGARAEAFYIVAPDTNPGAAVEAFLPRAGALPLLFHRDGGFWHLDQVSGAETALAPGTQLERLRSIGPQQRFAAQAYPETRVQAARAGERRRALPASSGQPAAQLQ
ncbi:FHA domain-containing protein [Massilia yuzhufengensis]|uniref:FHA domain-containing protein n=1 Tax=Massilia yuzhufengensis TaxID=1164594 RepID=A0A1I1PNT3_9BURK|nr:FHA domain-containing protein [Massilia yuzhufengensis]SFD11327.1 FHA domain-containing protein [Massilia yuzhufengensis]